MKKVSLIVLLVVMLSMVLMATVPVKMARLTIINKSEHDVYMKLSGSAVTEAFYYLTVPAGDRDEPSVKVFTVLQDVYARETWQCDGYSTSGQLAVSGNLRLTFTPCNTQITASAKNIRGEPTMEKVAAFRYLYLVPGSEFAWSDAYKYDGYWNLNCYSYAWRIREYEVPGGCYFRYQY